MKIGVGGLQHLNLRRLRLTKALCLFAAGVFCLSVAQGSVNLTAQIREDNEYFAKISSKAYSGPILTIDATGSGGDQESTLVLQMFDGETNPSDKSKHWHINTATANVRYIISEDWKDGYNVIAHTFRLYCCCKCDYPLSIAYYGSNTPEDENSWVLLCEASDLAQSDWNAAPGYIDCEVPSAVRGSYRAYKFVNTKSTGGWSRYGELEIYGEVVPDSRVVTVIGSPKDYGQVTPAYGNTKDVEPGAEIAFSATPVWTDEAGTITATCLGYTISSLTYDPVSNADVVMEVASGSGSSFTYTHFADSAGIVQWNWEPSYRLAIGTHSGHSVSVYTNAIDAACAISADCYLPKGSVVYAVAENGNETFKRWVGDVEDVGSPTSETISFTMDDSRKLFAAFEVSEELYHAKEYVGPNNGDWDDAANWLPVGVPYFNDRVFIPEGVRVDCFGGEIKAGMITISDNAALSVYGQTTDANQKIDFTQLNDCHSAVDGRRMANFSDIRTKPLKVEVSGDVRILGTGEMLIGGHFQQCWSDVTIVGDLRLEGSSKFDVYPGTVAAKSNVGITAEMRLGGRVEVLGEMSLAGGTQVRSFCHMGAPEYNVAYRGSAAAVLFDVGTITIAQNATFRSGLGLSHYSMDDISSLGAPSSVNYGGAGHGGIGGGGASGSGLVGNNGGATYGNEIAPILPGGYTRGELTVGGGVIRINAREMTLGGTIDATPSTTRFGKDWEHGSAAGGSIWITLENEPIVTESGLFRAAGLDGYLPSGFVHNVGGGGGGRIAVEVGLEAADISALYAGETPECCENMAPLASVFPGSVDVSGGQPGRFGGAGEAGTAVYARKITGDSIVVTIEPSGVSALGFSPILGSSSIDREETIAVSAPATFFVNAAETEQRVCKGWRLTTSDGAVLASGEGNETLFRPADFGDHTSFILTWDYSMLQYKVNAQVAGSGSVVESWGIFGEDAEMSATPASGKTFRMWLVDSLNTRAVLTEQKVVIPCHGAIEAVAVFSDAENRLQTKTYVGANGGNWGVTSNWSPEGVPTITDAVVIPEGKVVSISEKAIVGSLTIEDGAGVSVFGSTTALYSTIPGFTVASINTPAVGRQAENEVNSMIGVGILCAGDMTLNGTGYLAVGGVYQRRPSIVAIGGDLKVNDTACFSVHGGPVDEAHENDILLGGSRVVVCGTAHFGGASTNYFHGHFGTSIESGSGKEGTRSVTVLDAKKVIVEKDAVIVANDGSSYRAQNAFGGEGAAVGDSRLYGAGHGGKGGRPGSQAGGSTYDNPYAPLLPGRFGRSSTSINLGGGVVRIVADRIELSGTLDASATIRDNGWEAGGASGGSVLVIARKAKIESTAVVRACGGEGQRLNGGNTYAVGGGGGGRISFLINLKDEDLDGFLSGEEAIPGGVLVYDLTDAEELTASPFAGVVDVSGGIGWYTDEAGNGEDGTAYFIKGAPQSTMFIVR